MKRLGRPPYSCLITEGEAHPGNFQTERPRILETISEAVRDGVTVIQIREKRLPGGLLFALLCEAVAIAEHSPALILVNERADIAISAGGDGVHLPSDSIPPGVVRRIFADRLIVGVSTHSVEDALRAEREGADYVLFGPVFASPGKPAPVGIVALQQVCEELEIPVVALGGIDDTNFRQVLESGAGGLAAIRSLNNPDARRKIVSGMNQPSTR